MRNFLLWGALASVFTVNAQSTRHEFSLHMGGGISGLQYDVKIGDQKIGFGGNVGLDYTFFFSPNWGIGTGAEISLMNTKYKLSQFANSYAANDGIHDFEFRYTLSDYTEKQQLWNINVPLMLKFQTNGNTKFYAAAGGKIGFPIDATYKSGMGHLKTSGYYPQFNNELFGPRFQGFGEFDMAEKKSDMELKTMFLVSVEAGVKWKLANDWSLYTGAYLDYGLNNVSKVAQDQILLAYNNEFPTDFTRHTVLDSRYDDGGNLRNFTGDKMLPFSAGIKVAIAFGKSSGKRAVALNTDRDAEASHRAEREAAQAAEEERLKQQEALRLKEKESARRIAEEAKALKVEEKKQYEQAVKVIEKTSSGYSLGQTELSAERKAELEEKALLLKQYPTIQILCIGHTCDTGTDEVNQRVGMERAEATKRYLVSLGISPERITVQSKGKAEPLVPNTDEANRRINRRVEIQVKN